MSLVMLLRQSLLHNIDDVAEVRGQDVAARIREGELPSTLAEAGEEGGLVQVVDDSGKVVAATLGINGEPPLARFRPSGSEPEARTVKSAAVDGVDEIRILALKAASRSGPLTIYVANSLEPVTETIAILRNALAIGAPVLLMVIAGITWTVVGRALDPVEAMRSLVSEISDRSLERRIPVPMPEDEIGRLALTMNKMLDRLHAAAERQRRFVADASHELQTPLASARTDLEVGLAHHETTNWQEMASDLLVSTRRMEQLVQDLLFLAQADDAAPFPPPVLVDLDDVVLSEAAGLRSNPRVQVETRGVSAAEVRGRRESLARAVRNLLDNAGRHASSLVTVELGSDDHLVTLVVQDDGPGIAPSDRDRIFERFARLDDARTRDGGGAGLGLAIAKEIIKSHGGKIAVEDSPQGARLVVHLPSA